MQEDDDNREPPTRVICLSALTSSPMLIVNSPTKTTYRYRIDAPGGGIQRECEGVLAALPTLSEIPLFTRLHLPSGEPADEAGANQIDAVLAADPCTSFLKVDRSRLSSSIYGWLYVKADSPESTILDNYPEYTGPLYGFGCVTAVLVWTV